MVDQVIRRLPDKPIGLPDAALIQEALDREIIPVLRDVRQRLNEIIAAGVPPVQATYLLQTANALLTDALVLTAGVGITLTAGVGTLTVAASPLRPERVVNASRSALADDPEYTLAIDSASAITYTADPTVVPVGSVQYLYQKGAGQATIAGTTSDETLKLRRQY